MTPLQADAVADVSQREANGMSGERDGILDIASLKSTSARGLAINLVAQLARFVLQFGYQIVMARLLSPADFGLIALTSPFVGFAQLFADLGLSQATIQSKVMKQDQLSFAFWINVMVAGALSLTICALAPVVAWIYGDPRVVGPTLVSGALLLLGGLYAQHIALLTRRLRFLQLAAIDLGSLMIGAVVGVSAALAGMSYWSLLANTAAVTVCSLVLAWSLANWRPNPPPRRWGHDALMKFGRDVTAFNIVNYFARNLDNVLIGRFNGEASLGLYDRAYRLLLLPLGQISQPLSRVATPLLSRTLDTPQVYRRAYLRILEVTLILTYPGVLFALATCPSLIRVMLGPQWVGVAPIFEILGVGALIAPIGNSTGWLYLSQGRTREMRNMGAVSSALYVISFMVGLHWGPVGVAACYITTAYLRAPLIWWACTRAGPVSILDLVRTLMPFVFSGMVTFACLALATHELKLGAPSLILLFILAYVVFPLALAALPSGRAILAQIAIQLGKLLPLPSIRAFGVKVRRSLFRAVYWALCRLRRPNPRQILFLSSPEYSESSWAVCQRLARDDAQCRLSLNWLVQIPSATPPESLPRVHTAPSASFKGLWLFAGAGWIFYTHGLYPFARERRGQMKVNLWHGMPIKRIGLLDQQDSAQVLKPTYTIATSPLFQQIMARTFGLPLERVLLTGLPRNDRLIRPDRSAVQAWLGGWSHLVIWMPTFRQATAGMIRQDGSGNVVSPELLSRMDKALAGAGTKLLVKLHRKDALNQTAWPTLHNIRVVGEDELMKQRLNLYDVVGCADAIISDYSSVIVDALGAKKTVALFAPDEAGYHRGFNDGVMEAVRSATTLLPDEAALIDFIKTIPAVAGGANSSELHNVPVGDATGSLIAALGLLDPWPDRSVPQRHGPDDNAGTTDRSSVEEVSSVRGR